MHSLTRRGSNEYISRPKSAQGILKCPSPLSIYSVEADFQTHKQSELSPLVDFNYFASDQVIRSNSVSTGIIRPRRYTSSGISPSQNLQTVKNTRPLQSAFRTRSLSTQHNMFTRTNEKETLSQRTSCPAPVNFKLRPYNSFVGAPLIPQYKHSISLSDNDISLLWSRSKGPGENTDITKVYSLKVKRWFSSQAERLNATMAPKSHSFSFFQCFSYVEISWYPDACYTRSADKCRGCEGDFFQQEPCLLHDNRLWHYGCLRCHLCNHEIKANTPYLCPTDTEIKFSGVKHSIGGTQSLGRKRSFSFSPEYWKGVHQIICMNCVPTCTGCIHPVMQNHVMAIGRHWHHDCFRCSSCGEHLGENTKVYGKSGDVCCSRCIRPLFGQALSNPKLLRSALSLEDSDDPDTPLDNYGAKFGNNKICRDSSQLFSSVTEMASAFAYALSEHTEKNEEIPLPETHRNYSENLNAFLTHNSLDRRQLKERKRQKSAMISLTSSFKSEKGVVACPIVVPAVPTSLASYNTIINSHEGRSLLIDYCIENYEIDKIYFISDVEGIKDYDTEELDWLVLVRKVYKMYISPDGQPDMLLNLPKDIVDGIREKIRAQNCPMGIFHKARDFVLNQVEKNIVKHFLKSSYGSQYLKALVSFDNVSRQVIRSISRNVNKLEIDLSVIGYDKRHDTNRPKGKSKYYVYEIQVRIGDYEFTVFRAYREFYNLHENLKKEFPKQLPQFPHKIYLRRSEVKSIAKQRATDLSDYLQDLVTKKPEISKHQELLTFIKQTETDVKDEEFNNFLTLHGVRNNKNF